LRRSIKIFWRKNKNHDGAIGLSLSPLSFIKGERSGVRIFSNNEIN